MFPAVVGINVTGTLLYGFCPSFMHAGTDPKSDDECVTIEISRCFGTTLGINNSSFLRSEIVFQRINKWKNTRPQKSPLIGSARRESVHAWTSIGTALTLTSEPISDSHSFVDYSHCIWLILKNRFFFLIKVSPVLYILGLGPRGACPWIPLLHKWTRSP